MKDPSRTVIVACMGALALAALVQSVYAEESTVTTQPEVKLGEVRRENGRVTILGVERFHWGAGPGEHSYPGALHAALQTVGENVTYEWLLGVSGLAFRTQMHRPYGCPSSPHPACGFDNMKPLEAALNYSLQWMKCDEKDAAGVAKIREAVKRSLDAGRPVVQYSEEADLIVGYEQDGAQWLLRAYCDKSKEYKPAKRWPWGVALLGEKKHPPVDRAQSARRSLELALEMWKAPTAGKYACGEAALKEWTALLANTAQCEALLAKDSFGLTLANAHTFCCLYDARESAWRYLDECLPLFEGTAREHLQKARDLYREEAQGLVAKQCAVTTAPYPWMIKQGRNWTTENRQYQSELLRAATEKERLAIAELEGALKPIR